MRRFLPLNRTISESSPLLFCTEVPPSAVPFYLITSPIEHPAFPNYSLLQIFQDSPLPSPILSQSDPEVLTLK